MKTLLWVLSRVVVYEFYKINSGFFFLIFCLSVATIHNPEQLFTYPFLSRIVQSEGLILVFFGIVGLYARKCYVYLIRCIADKRNGFFLYLPLAGKSRALSAISITFLLLLAPLAMYSLLLIFTAASIGRWSIALAIPVFFVLLVTCISSAVVRKISNTDEGYKGGSRINPFARSRFYYGYFISFFLDRLKLTFLSTKILSVATLVGVTSLYVSYQYPMMIVYMGVLVAMTFHFVLIFEARKFEDQYLLILRNLPMRFTVYVVYVIAYCFVIMPELVAISFLTVKMSIDIFLVPLYGVSILLSLHILGYFSSMRMRVFFRFTLIFFFAHFFALLLNTPIGVLIASNFGLSCAAFYFRYFDYEVSQ